MGVKVRVAKATLEGLGQAIASKVKDGTAKPNDSARMLDNAVEDNPSIFKEHASRTRGRIGTNPTPRVDDAEGGLLQRWRSDGDAASRGGGELHADPEIKAQANGIAQKAYHAIVLAEPGDPELDQLCDDRSEALHRKFHELHDALVLADAIARCQHRDFDAKGSKLWTRYERLALQLMTKVAGERVSKIMTTGGSGTGLEFIPNTMSGSLIPLIKQELTIVPLFDDRVMPTSPWKLPIEGADYNAFLVAEASDDNVDGSGNVMPAATKATAGLTITAKKLGARALISTEESEDAIIDAVGFARAGMARAFAESLDDAVLNGDDLGSLDVDSAGATDRRRAWKGLRKLTDSTAKVDFGNAALTATKLVNLLTKMGKFAQQLAQTVFIVSPIGYAHLCGDTNFNRFDAQGAGGAAPTLVTGQVGTIFGRPVVISGKVREDLNHVGTFDGSGTTKTVALAVHRPSFRMYDRRLVTIRAADLIQSDRILLAGTWRGFFGREQPESSSPIARNVAVGFNINKNATF